MINQLNTEPTIPQNIMDEIDKLKPLTGGEWDIKNNADITQFKESLKLQLLVIQDEKCAYCGLPFGETGKTEIEHFAPKGGAKRPKHPEFAFTVSNLVLSCNLCNSPVKKGNYDSVKVKNVNYNLCIFKIVHPYFDDHSLHYAWTNDSEKVLIQGASIKGRESIQVFKLNSTRHSEARARIKINAYLLTIEGGVDLIAAALNYNP
jgi:uncharacterized protein (TIGR02646 family)